MTVHGLTTCEGLGERLEKMAAMTKDSGMNPTEKTTANQGQLIGMTVDVKLVGRKPGLLMSNFPERAIEASIVRKQRVKVDTTAPLRTIAEPKLFREDDEDPKSQIGLPSQILMACLREAGRKVQLKGLMNMSKADGETIVFATIDIDEPFIHLLNPETGNPVTDKDWRASLKIVNQGGTTAPAIRPHFRHWAMKFRIEVDLTADGNLSPAKIEELFKVAGKRMGLCAFRPTCGGPYGTFNVAEWNVVDRRYCEVEA